VLFCQEQSWLLLVSTTFLEKLDANISQEVLFALIKSKCLPILFYGTETCPLNSADRHSLEFTMNKVLYKIFVTMTKDSYGEIGKYFGIDKKVEESIHHRQKKIVKRYSGYSNSLCRSIFARL